MSTLSCIELLDRWHLQVCWLRSRDRGPRGIGALGYLVDGEQPEDLVELERLLLVVVYDDQFAPGRMAIRVGGYRASRVEGGVAWGGSENSRIYKDLTLQPRPGGGHMRMDLLKTPVLDLGLRLNRRIDKALRYQPSRARRGLRLPPLWAGFPPDVAAGLTGGGPELEALAAKFGIAAESMSRKFQREHQGLKLFPLDWVSDRLADAVGVFAELAEFPRQQTFGVDDPALDLVGYEGAGAFDFYNSATRASWPPPRATTSDYQEALAAC